jgi:ABC-2 type transport system ATP-binding protein
MAPTPPAQPAGDDAIVTEQLAKHYPAVRAVDGIDLRIEAGSIFGFLGINGSGKTTTIRMLTTLTRPTSGRAWVGGIDVRANPTAVRASIGVALQEAGLDDFQTGRNLLTLQGHLFGMSNRDIKQQVEHLLAVVDLEEAADRPLKTYSGGMRRRLDLASALVHRPKIVFLDEPTTGLDPNSREAVWAYVEHLNREEGVTLFLTTQYLEEADRLAHRVAIISEGKIVTQGTPADLKASVGADVVTLTFQTAADAARASDLMATRPDVERAQADDDQVVVYVKHGAAALSGFILALDEARLHPATVKLAEPTLDDVFMRQTGHFMGVGGTQPDPSVATTGTEHA